MAVPPSNVVLDGDVGFVPTLRLYWHTVHVIPVFGFHRLTLCGGTAAEREETVQALRSPPCSNGLAAEEDSNSNSLDPQLPDTKKSVHGPLDFHRIIPSPTGTQLLSMYPAPCSCMDRVISSLPGSLQTMCRRLFPPTSHDPLKLWRADEWNVRSNALLAVQLSAEELASDAREADAPQFAGSAAADQVSFVFLTEGTAAPLPIVDALAARFPTLQWMLESETGVDRMEVRAEGRSLRLREWPRSLSAKNNAGIARLRRRLHFVTDINERMLLFARVAGIDRFVKNQYPSLRNTWLRILRISNADSFIHARCDSVDVTFTLDEPFDSAAEATGNDVLRGWLQRLDSVSDVEFSVPTALHKPREWRQFALDQVRRELAQQSNSGAGSGVHAVDGSTVEYFELEQQVQQPVDGDDENQSLIALPY
jgi:hypothetical protein